VLTFSRHLRSTTARALAALLALFALLLGIAPQAQAAEARSDLFVSIGGGLRDTVLDTVVDRAGNIYLTGAFGGAMNLGSGATLIAEGPFDAFVAKLRPDGTLVWATRAGGANGDVGGAIAVDEGGNVYVSGEFRVSAAFVSAKNSADPQRFRTLDALDPSGDDQAVFLARYRPDGTLDWAARAISDEGLTARGVDVDSQGNAYIVGGFSGAIELLAQGAAPGSGQTLRGRGLSDLFVARYSPAGEVAWSRGAESTEIVNGDAIAVDASGVYVAGFFEGKAEFQSAGVSRSIESTASQDGFAASYTRDGAVRWAVRLGNGNDNDSASDIDTGGGSVFVSGSLGRESNGDRIMLAKLAGGDGRFLDSAVSDSPGGDAVAVAPNGDVYVGGRFRLRARFGRANESPLALEGRPDNSVFVAGFAPDLTPRFAASNQGSPTRTSAQALATDVEGNAYLAGAFEGRVTFGEKTLTLFGNENGYLARFRVTGGAPTPTPAPPSPPSPTPTPPSQPVPDCDPSVIYLSTTAFASAPGVGSFADEDVVAFDPDTRQWSMLFDGSDIPGLAGSDIDAFHWMEDDTLLLSFLSPENVIGIGEVDDSDVVRFIPTRLGTTTTGRFELFFDGSDVGLTTDGEDVDAITVDERNGRLMLSILSTGSVRGNAGEFVVEDEDVLEFRGTLGPNTQGTFGVNLDGSQVGLTSVDEDVSALWAAPLDPVGLRFFLGSQGAFSLSNGLRGNPDEIFVCERGAFPPACRSALFFDGSAAGLRGNIDAFALGLKGVLGEIGGEVEAEPSPEPETGRDDPDRPTVFLPLLAR
jgi:hypothetical protein